MKKGLVFVLIAVVSAAFLVVGCKQGTDSGSTTSVQIGGRLVDIAVTTEADLVVALDNADYQVIGVTGDENDDGFYGSGNKSLQDVTEIPADKTVVLYRPLTPGRTLAVKGTLIVEGNGNLVTTHGTAEVEVTSGRIEVINGTITTDVTEAIHGVPVTQEIFGTPKVQFAGGILSIGDPLSTFEKVKTIFGWVPHGMVVIDKVTEAVKPSDVAAVPTTSVRRLTITETVPVAGSGDTVGALVIPAGLSFKTADPLSSLTSLDVKGSLNATDALLSRLETLTVSGSLTAASASYTKVKALTVGAEFEVTRDLGALETLTVTAGGAFEGVGVGGTEGVTITVASGASAEVGAITNLKPSTIEGALIAASYTVYGAGGTPAPGTPLSVAARGTVNGITFPAPVKVAAVAADSATIEGITIEEDQLLTIPASATLVIAAGAPGTGETPAENLFVYEGQVVIEATGNLVLATASTANVGRIKGTGTITAGTTTITGAWEAVAATTDAGTLTILGAATGATITADGTNATGLKASAAGAAITQAAAANNNLSIGAATVINLDGTDAAAVGKLVLTGDGTNPAKLTLAAVTATVQCGSPTLTTKYGSAAKIGGKTFGSSTADVYTAANTDAAGKFGGIKGSDVDKNFVGGDATNTIEIDSTKEVTA